MNVRGLDHVGVTGADLERSLAFYRDLLGLTPLGAGESSGADVAEITGFPGARIRWAELDLGGGQILELLQYVHPEGHPLSQRTCDPGSGHLALLVDDVDALHRRFAEAGVVIRSSPVMLEEEGAWKGVRVLYALDPDGVTVELVERAGTRG